MLQWNGMRIWALSDGRFALDGGAMFGIVPKPLWSKKIAADEQNRIPMALRCLLVQTGERLILVDTSVWIDHLRRRSPRLEAVLRAAGC